MGRSVVFSGIPSLIGMGTVMMVLSGCGGADHPETYPVTGVVQHNGEPLPNVAVTFTPWEGSKGRSAVGRTDENGQFTLTTFESEDGAVKGTHRVTIAVVGESSDPAQNAEDYSVPPPPPFPRKYLAPSTSDIEISVPEDTSSGEVVIELKGSSG